jgi:hypothetical protein
MAYILFVLIVTINPTVIDNKTTYNMQVSQTTSLFSSKEACMTAGKNVAGIYDLQMSYLKIPRHSNEITWQCLSQTTGGLPP